MYINKESDDSHIHFEPKVALPDKVEVKTGEEDELVLFESRAKMYRFVTSEWKEKGVGVLKILEHKENKKSRVLMRRDQVLKICCNHLIDPIIKLEPMARTEGKAWTWFAMDFAEEEAKVENLAVRFKNAEIADKFKTAFEKCKENAKDKDTPKKAEATPKTRLPGSAVQKEILAADSTTNEEDDDVIFVCEEKAPIKNIKEEPGIANDDENDVIFIQEDKATPEQVDLARKYLLPEHFFLENPPCPGCIGCTDGEPPFKTTSQTKVQAKSPKEDKSAKPAPKP